MSTGEEQPVAGIESYANFYLRGQNGWVESEKDGRQHELAQFRTREVPAADGYGVVLSIDAVIQHMAEAELANIVEKFRPLKATIIVSDPRTGFILALANTPTFDLNGYNKLPKAEQNRLRNIAVADMYEPGSVFKIVAASGALNEGLVTPATTFDCTQSDLARSTTAWPDGALGLGEDRFDHFHRPLTVAQIIGRSSNKGRRSSPCGSATGASTTTRAPSALASSPASRSAATRPRGPAEAAGKMGRPHHHAHADGPVGRRDAAADAPGDGRHRERRRAARPQIISADPRRGRCLPLGPRRSAGSSPSGRRRPWPGC